MTEDVFGKGMHSLHVAYNRQPTQDIRDLYREALRELTDRAFLTAVAETIKSERFFPSPAVLLEHGRAALPGPSPFPALPPAQERRTETLEGIAIFKRELKAHGVDVDELVKEHSWPGRKSTIHGRAETVGRIPGEDDL